MGSRMADSIALVTRCERAGWDVIKSPDGYKIRDTSGGTHIVHLTYSDVRSLNNITRQVEAAGLSEAEAAVKQARLTEGRSRSQVAAEAAEKRARDLASKASVNRASGPYMLDPEDVELEWFLTPHPAPWMRWVNITPRIARALVGPEDGRNTDNRTASKDQIRHYREVIKAGLWRLTHQGIAIDTRGIVQDGQHRMLAQLAATEDLGYDVTLPYAVFVGMPEENFKVIDEGMLRNARQLFGKAGEKNASPLQTAVRLVHYAGDGDARRSARLKLANQIIVDEFGANAEEFREVTRLAMRDHNKCFTSTGALAAAMYLIRRVNGPTNEYVGQFYDGFTTGRIAGTRVVLDDDDPRQILRDKLQKAKLRTEGFTALTQMGMIITTWNNCVSNRYVRVLHFNNESTIPAPLKCIPGEGIRPTAFGTLVTGDRAA